MNAILEMLEKDWDAQLFSTSKGLATTLGWTLVYHTLRSKGSPSGFPDRVLVRDRVVYAELKREGQKPTERQRVWLDGLAAAGAEAYLWRPLDLDEIGRILGTRWKFVHGSPATAGYLELDHVARQERWTPGSLWIAGYGREDS